MKIDVRNRNVGEVWYAKINGYVYRMEYIGNNYVAQKRMNKAR